MTREMLEALVILDVSILSMVKSVLKTYQIKGNLP